MANRSASTGVLVTLVLFVILSIGLMVVGVLQWMDSKKLADDLAKERNRMRAIANPAELESADVGRLQTGAQAAGKSLVAYLVDLNQQFSGQFTGDRAKVMDDKALAQAAKDLGVPEGGSVRSTVSDLRKASETSASELKSLKDRLDALKAQLESAAAASKGGASGSEALAKATQALADLSAATEAYRAEAETLAKSRSDSKQDFERRVTEVQNERNTTVEGLKASSAMLQTQLDQAQKKLSQFDVGLQNPALAIDGHVIEVNGSDGQIFIDLGKQQRLQPGTTFEVFESPDQLRSSGEQGLRGKASVQIMRVGDVTSVARVVRQSPGRPVVRGDLIANAVYSPGHTYRFLVHGMFNIDGDGIPSSAETELIVQRIKDWGGTVSPEDRVTGDLDFVVLGEPPREPPPLAPTASAAEVAAFQQAKAAKNQYEQILGDATRARIPVLNWNRFQSLTGMSND